MTSIVTDFKSIKKILDRQEQKAEFEENNPKPESSMYGWPYGVAVPFGGLSAAVQAFVDGWEYDETLRMWRNPKI